MSSHDLSWQGHVRFSIIPLGHCFQFCCSTSQVFFTSWYRDSASPRHGLLCHRGSPEARLDKPSITEWWARPISYHKQQQRCYHPITDQEIKCRRVLKGIIWAILGFFTIGCGGEWHSMCSVTALCGWQRWSILVWEKGQRKCGAQKQICFLQRGCLATTAAPHFCLDPSLPLQRDPLCNPNWDSGCLTLKTLQHHTRLKSHIPTLFFYLLCKHHRGRCWALHWAGNAPDVFIASATIQCSPLVLLCKWPKIIKQLNKNKKHFTYLIIKTRQFILNKYVKKCIWK